MKNNNNNNNSDNKKCNNLALLHSNLQSNETQQSKSTIFVVKSVVSISCQQVAHKLSLGYGGK